MSQENVERLAHWFEQAEQCGDEWIDYWYANAWAEDIVNRAIVGAPDDVGEMVGRDAAHRYFEDWTDTFEGFRIAAEEIIDAGGDRVIVVEHVTGQARISGAPVDLRAGVVFTISKGRIISRREYHTKAEAFDAIESEG